MPRSVTCAAACCRPEMLSTDRTPSTGLFPLGCLPTALAVFFPCSPKATDAFFCVCTLFPPLVLDFLSRVLTVADDFSLSLSALPFLFQ